MRRTLLVTAIAVSLLAWTVPTAAADDVAGASGQCFDDDGTGGNAHLAVTDGAEVERTGLADEENPDNNPPEGGAVDAVLALTDENGEPAEGNGCTSEDENEQDYLEAHVAGQQVCYDGDVRTDGECPQRV